MSFKTQVTTAYKTAIKTAAEVNEAALTTGEEVVNEILSSGKQWSKLGKKAINGGVKLAAKQQDITLSAIEEVKQQLAESKKRFYKIMSTK